MSDKVADLIKGYVDLEIMHFWEILSEKWHSSKNKSPDPFSKKIATTLRDFQKDLIETKYENEFFSKEGYIESKEGYIKKIDEVYKKHQENILKYLRDNLKEIESLKNNSEFNSILECKEGRIDFCLSFLNKSAKVKICPELQGKKLFSIEDIRSEEIQIKLSILYSMLFHLQLHETSRNHFYFLDQYKDSKDSNLLKIIECLWYLIKFLTDKSKDFNDNELKKDAINLLKIIFLIRRGFAYDLSSQPQKAFNDFSKVQAILSELKTELQKKYYTILVSYIYSLKGDLYRRNYCFYNAHQYYCNCIETIEKFEEESEKFEDESKSSQDQEFNIFYSLKKVKIKINKGKTFLTLGEFKKSLKWFFNALEDLLKIVQKQEEKEEKKEENISKLIESIQNISKYLEEQKLENYIDKNKLSKKINDFIELIEKVQISKYPNLISDILVRISYILILLKVKKEKANYLPNSLLTRALKFNKFNALACLNRLILNREDKSSNEDIPDITSLMHYGNLQDVIYRNFFISILAELNKLSFQQNGSRKDNDLINPETAKNLLKEAISISEDFSVKNAEMYRFLMRNGAISQCNERDGRPYFDEDYVYLYGLQRWSSINPAVIRPSAFKIKGGGLLIIYKGKGIAIDPGINFVENLYGEGFSLEDIHYIIVSHDHIDHLGDLDILLSLFYRRSQLEPKEKRKPIYLLLNPSVSSRYSFLNNQDRKLFYKIELNPIEVPDERPKKYKWLSIDSNFKIKPFFVNHKDLAARNVSNSIGFVLSFKLNEEEFKIMFTNDTHLYEEDVIQKDDTNQKNAQQSEKSNLKEILENLISRENPNIFVANINSASFRELLAASGLELNNNHVSFQKLDDCLNKYEDIKKQILYSLGFPKKPSLESIADDNVKWDRLYKSRELGEHLCLWGTKELFEIFKKSSKGPKLFLIGETNEEMGNFRHKIAKELNKKSNLPCLTLDIGVCIKANHEKILARCSLCELDNDEETKFHELDKIKGVCVKFEEEGLFHFCKNHDPGKNNKFIERLERFQPLRHVDMRLK